MAKSVDTHLWFDISQVRSCSLANLWVPSEIFETCVVKFITTIIII